MSAKRLTYTISQVSDLLPIVTTIQKKIIYIFSKTMVRYVSVNSGCYNIIILFSSNSFTIWIDYTELFIIINIKKNTGN